VFPLLQGVKSPVLRAMLEDAKLKHPESHVFPSSANINSFILVLSHVFSVSSREANENEH